MAKPNYQFEKRQKELAKKRKKEEKRLRKLHPYKNPEIVAIEAGAASQPYAAWVAAATQVS